MTVLVTGGAGYIGSHMTLELLSQDESVVVLDNLSTGVRDAVPDEVSFIYGDVGDEALVSTVLKEHAIDAIIHFAGSIIVPESIENPLKYYQNNTANSRNLIAAAIEQNIRHFIFSSTAAVYGMPDINPVKETTSTQPISPYGTSKLMTELMLADTAKVNDFAYIALRYFNVAGADPNGRSGQSTPNATHLIKLASKTALGQRDSLDVFGTDYETKDGTCIRDYIHVSDLASAHWHALQYLREGGQSDIFNCGYGKGSSVLEVIDAVERSAGVEIKRNLTGRRAGDPEALIANTDRIHKKMNWQPQFDNLDVIVDHALAWERKLMGDC